MGLLSFLSIPASRPPSLPSFLPTYLPTYQPTYYSLSCRVYDLLAPDGGGGGVLCELAAHKTPLSALAWSQDGRLLASGSHKGTVIRVHR